MPRGHHKADLAEEEQSRGLALVLGTVSGVQAAATLAVLSISTLAPSVAETLGVGAELVGYQVSLTYLAAAAVSLVAGVVVRRWGAGTTSAAAMVLAFLGAIGLATGNIALLIVATLLIGAGYGLTNPAASHLLYRHTRPSQRNIVFSIKQTGVPIGGILAGLLLPGIAERAGWQTALLACSAVAAIMLLILLWLREGWDVDRIPRLPLRTSIVEALSLVWNVPALRNLALTGFCFSAIQLSLVAFIVTFLVQELGWSLVAAGTVAATVQLSGAFSRIVWGAAADRAGKGLHVLALIGVLSFASAVATATLSPASPNWLAIAILCCFGASAIGWNGVFLAQVATMSAVKDVGSATGGALFFTFAGVVFGPALFTLLYKLIGSYGLTFAILALMPLLGSYLIIRIIKPDSD